MFNLSQTIAKELSITTAQVEATIALLDEGASVPFIARYRKERTGALDDTQLRGLEERLHYLRELADRKQTILNAIQEQNKLTDQLSQAIHNATTKTALEDLYLPYKKKRKTKGQIAIEAGLKPLSEQLFNDRKLDPEQTAKAFINKNNNINDTAAALAGAKYILMEHICEQSPLLSQLREKLSREGALICRVAPDKEQQATKYQDYFDYHEAYNKVPSHRALAVFRGRNEGMLHIHIDLYSEQKPSIHPCEQIIHHYFDFNQQGLPADQFLSEVFRWAFKIKIHPHIETDLITQLKQRSEHDAIGIFAVNLKDLLLAAPAGAKATLAIDPGLRTGCKIAVVDRTGKLLNFTTIYPHPPQKNYSESLSILSQLLTQYDVALIAIGNGTASRETDRLVNELIKQTQHKKVQKVIVSEAGASVYSASALAAAEFPDLDVTIRGAVSIARRLQDPLAELVKIEPKAIGVGQYQHDVSQLALAKTLNTVVEDSVNAVGVDVNMASSALLARVSGLNNTLAKNIVDYRDANGRFTDRNALKLVKRFGDKTFEQAAGFLRINNGTNPLDASAVHPESYAVVDAMAKQSNQSIEQLIGNKKALVSLKLDRLANEAGLLTLKDIVTELQKPGRDPRPEFKTAELKEGIETINDLKIGMLLQGTVSNVTAFGAFVDLGVHQDGLVHISALSERFVEDPRAIVKAGDIVKVKVLEVDAQRKRIALSMRLNDEVKSTTTKSKTPRPKSTPTKQPTSAFAAAFAKAKHK